MVRQHHIFSFIIFALVAITAAASTAPERTDRLRYDNLSQALIHYQYVLSQRPSVTFGEARLLRQGDRHEQVARLRYQLRLLGDYAPQPLPPSETDYFDASLAQALQRFQHRHGEKVDGILGPDSRRQLNLRPHQRLNQLRVNIHRQLLYQPVDTGVSIRVNIPEFRLHLYQNRSKLLELNTIVGRNKRKTPVFNTAIEALVVNPSWSVPKSIAWRDIIPEWRNDPEYLARQNLRIVRGYGQHRQVVDAAKVDPDSLYLTDQPHYLWEPPGQGNTLGRVKFMSTSQYAIYLHDTSARNLFTEPRRAFSSGCIRVDDALNLARLLLELDQPAARQQLDDDLKSLETREIFLKQPVPVHITYWTAWIDEAGLLHFRDDIYRRDLAVLEQLAAVTQSEDIRRSTAD